MNPDLSLDLKQTNKALSDTVGTIGEILIHSGYQVILQND